MLLIACTLSNHVAHRRTRHHTFTIGQDASEAFEDVGHSEDARLLLKDYHIGDLEDDAAARKKDYATKGGAAATAGKSKKGTSGDDVMA